MLYTDIEYRILTCSLFVRVGQDATAENSDVVARWDVFNVTRSLRLKICRCDWRLSLISAASCGFSVL